MSKSLNRVELIGNVKDAPEVRFTGSGVAVCSIDLATNESYKDKEGVQQESTEWHRLVAWGKVAEILGEHLERGAQIYVDGKLKTRSYEDKEGVTKYVTEITIRDFMFLSRKGGSSDADTGSSSEVSDDEVPY